MHGSLEEVIFHDLERYIFCLYTSIYVGVEGVVNELRSMLTSRTCYILLPGARELIVRFCGNPLRYTSEALRVRSILLIFNGYSQTSTCPLAGLECTADELICNAN